MLHWKHLSIWKATGCAMLRSCCVASSCRTLWLIFSLINHSRKIKLVGSVKHIYGFLRFQKNVSHFFSLRHFFLFRSTSRDKQFQSLQSWIGYLEPKMWYFHEKVTKNFELAYLRNFSEFSKTQLGEFSFTNIGLYTPNNIQFPFQEKYSCHHLTWFPRQYYYFSIQRMLSRAKK